MAWEWSHTVEALGYAREVLAAKDKDELVEIVGEWKATPQDSHGRYSLSNFNSDDYLDAVHEAEQLSVSELVEYIWKCAEEYRICTNGGHELYMCPHGCHTVDLRDMPKNWTPSE